MSMDELAELMECDVDDLDALSEEDFDQVTDEFFDELEEGRGVVALRNPSLANSEESKSRAALRKRQMGMRAFAKVAVNANKKPVDWQTWTPGRRN